MPSGKMVLSTGFWGKRWDAVGGVSSADGAMAGESI
jgi:hypothetical protein